MVEALALCRLLVNDGVTTVIATPHQMGRYEGAYSAKSIREKAAELRAALAQEGVPLAIEVGADVRIDSQLNRLIDADEVLSLADGKRYLLLELPHEIFIEPRAIVAELLGRGVCPIMTHPERYNYLQKKPQAIQAWVEQGALVQITAGSFVGDFGPAAQKAAWEYLSRGWVSLVATDAHDSRSRPPRMSAAIEAISQQSSHTMARRLCIENPLAVLEGGPIAGPRPRPKMRAMEQPGGGD